MRLPTPNTIKNKLPLSLPATANIQKSRSEIKKILNSHSPLWIFVVGPCSLHNVDSSIEYAKKLQALQSKVKDSCLLVMRAHIEKPRTCLGWKGLVQDPYLTGEGSIEDGILICRKLFLDIAALDVPIATEFLDPLLSLYFSDLVSWGFIGARTCTSQVHRQIASDLPMPVGFKNSLDGNLESAILGAKTAQSPHVFVHVDSSGHLCTAKSSGNPDAHIVLRGSFTFPNYTPNYVKEALEKSQLHGVHSSLLIDCSHGNSKVKPSSQKEVCFSVLDQYLSGRQKIMGVMIESHLKPGNQTLTPFADPEVSVTDPCLGWDETEEMILKVHESLQTAALLCCL